MSVLDGLAWASLALAALPATLTALNLALYRRPRRGRDDGATVSVLIPARNEERAIAGAVRAALADPDPDLEVLVMDDHSEDGTAAVVERLAQRDPRLRLLAAPPLPAGWNGKQHACAELAAAASRDLLLFVDADVRLAPGAVRRIAGELARGASTLVSGVPRQRLGSPLERLLVPLIHLVLLGYLPVAFMRRSKSPAFAAGCGQLIAVRRRDYERFGGHRAIRSSRHDGLALPRACRRAGFRTDLFDATGEATCRMYRSGAEVWTGFAKNATEGLASPGGVLPWTLLLGGGHVAPWILAARALAGAAGPGVLVPAAAAVGLNLMTRAALALRFRQPKGTILLHPLAVTLLLLNQWYALGRRLAGTPLAWKGRTDDATVQPGTP